ncbi:hypothetical protein ABT127_34780 [Streptomyces sp. NPDC001904]|uniref:hypothetical protein n=1 Tax=Streptomyces sp. NPDC001904 TaxID=3154531 RepID=UPI00332C3223
MAVITLVGLPGAPGVTSTAMALLRTWPLTQGWRVVLAECDPDGGSILPGALQGQLEADRGLRNLAISSRIGPQDLATAFWQQLFYVEADERQAEGRRMLLAGLTDMGQASSLAPVWPELAELFGAIEDHRHDVLVDLGRNGAFGPAGVLARRADLVLVVMRGTLRSLHMGRARMRHLRSVLEGDDGRGASAHLEVVLIREGPYGPREVEEAVGVPVIAQLPFRPDEAAVLSDGAGEGSKFMKSKLMSAAAVSTTAIRQRVAQRRTRLISPVQQRLQGVSHHAR